jgi:hypothetical protein
MPSNLPTNSKGRPHHQAAGLLEDAVAEWQRILFDLGTGARNLRTTSAQASKLFGGRAVSAHSRLHLDMGCVAAHGTFTADENGVHVVVPRGKPATAFLLELIARLQSLATVPMIDVRAYAKWLDKE